MRVRKLTYKDVYEDFRRRFRNISERAMHWHPYDVETIMIYFPKGVKATYNYHTKELEGYCFDQV